MIKNPIISEKVKEKTAHNNIMREYIMAILDNESEGKQFRKFFTKGIKDAVKKYEKNGGGNT